MFPVWKDGNDSEVKSLQSELGHWSEFRQTVYLSSTMWKILPVVRSAILAGSMVMQFTFIKADEQEEQTCSSITDVISVTSASMTDVLFSCFFVHP